MQRTEQDRHTGVARLAELLCEVFQIGVNLLTLPCALLDRICSAECREVAAVCRGFHIERDLAAALFGRDIPVERHGRDAALVLVPRDHALRRVVLIGLRRVVEQEVDAADRGLLACFFLNILKFRFVVYEIVDLFALRFPCILIIIV